MWWSIIPEFISKAGGTLMSFFSLFLLGKNSRLTKENEILKLNAQDKDKIIAIQNKVLDATANNQTTSPYDAIERMRQGKW